MISNSAIIVICVVSAAAAVMICWALTNPLRSRGGSDEEAARPPEQDQYSYMMEVRQRNRDRIMIDHGLRAPLHSPGGRNTPGGMTMSSGY